MASCEEKYMETLITKLSFESDSKIKRVLIELTKMTKNKENAHLFCLKGGLKCLFTLIKRPNRSIADIALSTLANCALESGCRKEIRRLDGIAELAIVLKTFDQTSVLNRTARALANLAEDELSVQVIEECGIISELVKLLIKTSDTNCQQSTLRALRMVCTTVERKQAILELDAVKTIADLLKSKTPTMVNCCMKAMAELVKGCSKEMAQQFQEQGVITNIVELAKRNIVSVQVRHWAVLSLSSLACHANVRGIIGKEGGIEVLTQHMNCNESAYVAAKAIEGLCFCCREGVNRYKVFTSGALEDLLKMLSLGLSWSLKKKIVSAFTCFCHYNRALDALLNAGLVPILITHLNEVISHLPNRNEGEDLDTFDFSDQLSFSSDFPSDSPSSNKDEHVFFYSSNEALMDNTFWEKMEETAKEVHVRDSEATGKHSNFKRRMKLKPSPIRTTPPFGICTVGSGQSVFSFARGQMDTTSLVSVCTFSHSISSVASSSGCDDFLNPGSGSRNPRVLTSSRMSSPVNSPQLSHEQNQKQPDGDQGETRSFSVDKPGSLLMPSVLKSGKQSHPVAMASTNTNTITNSSPALPSSPKTPPVMHHHRSPGHSVLVLLSRISFDEHRCSLLASKPCIQALLNHFCLVDNPRCERILSSVVSQPLCFRGLVMSGAVTAIHHQLCCLSAGESQDVLDTDIPCNTEKQVDGSSPSSCPAEWETSKAISRNVSSGSSTHEQDTSIKTSTEGQLFHHMSSGRQNYCQETGKQLLEKLSRQAQISPFSNGELENLLLRGSKEEVNECLLALPLLCRTKKLKQQMLGEKKTLKRFCGLFSSAPPSSKMFTFAVESLIVLVNDLQVQFPHVIMKHEEKASTADQVESLFDKKLVRSGDDLVEPHAAKKLKLDSSVIKMGLSMRVEKKGSLCLYESNSFGPFDMEVQMDSGQVFGAHKHILKGASDVFHAMLSGDCYLESTQSIIAIREVSNDAFQFALHQMYGCTALLNATEAASCRCEVLQGVRRKGKEAEFFLELLEFSNRFMLDQLRTVAEESLVNLIDSSSVVQICFSSLHLNSPVLCQHCLAYLVQVSISELPARLHLFKELFLRSDQEELVDSLFQLLLSYF